MSLDITFYKLIYYLDTKTKGFYLLYGDWRSGNWLRISETGSQFDNS